MKLILVILFTINTAYVSFSQPCTFKLSGHVEDEDTKEKLLAATVSIKETGKQIITDSKGDFVFSGLCIGDYTILITHINCDAVEQKIKLVKDYHVDIVLPHNRTVLGSVVLDAQKNVANTGFKKELSGKALEQTKGLSLAEALSKINGVTMLQTGSTISKPIIHGLHSNRILTINNGVRQEGQQWGNEHAPEIDPFIADKLVVIKGVNELKYGSDAIGGVILVEPKTLRNKPGYNTEINSIYFSNNNQYVLSALFEQQLKKLPAFTYRVQGTYKKAANVTTPNYRLNNTASEEKNFSVTASWKKDKFNTELFYSHFSTQLGIFTGAHIGNLTDLLNAIDAPKPDDVFLGQRTYKIQRPSQDVTHDLVKSKTLFYKKDHKFSIMIAGQFNHRKEFDIVRSATNKNPQLDLSVATVTGDFTWEHPKKNNFNGVVGLSLVNQNNTYAGRYFIPNYIAKTFGGYYLEKWSKHKWELHGGVRYDNKTVETKRLKFGNDTINNDFYFSTFASSFNIVFKPNTNWTLNTNLSIAARAPHVNELLSDGIHHGTATFEKGDINLKQERSANFSTGVNYKHPSNNFSFDFLLYSNRINDFIYQQPRPGNPVLTIAGAFPLIEYQQTDATLKGFDLSTVLKPLPNIELNSKFSYLHATNRKLNDWLILMPANRFSNEVSYNLKDINHFKDSYISAEVMHVMQQKNVPSDINGKQDYKVPPAAYTLVNLQASTAIPLYTIPVTISFGVRNLFNTVYRDYLNSMRYFTDEMGRNISVRLKIKL